MCMGEAMMVLCSLTFMDFANAYEHLVVGWASRVATSV